MKQYIFFAIAGVVWNEMELKEGILGDGWRKIVT